MSVNVFLLTVWICFTGKKGRVDRPVYNQNLDRITWNRGTEFVVSLFSVLVTQEKLTFKICVLNSIFNQVNRIVELSQIIINTDHLVSVIMSLACACIRSYNA